MTEKIMKPYAFGYEVGLASKSDVSPNTRADEICRESMYREEH
ncbi:MAG: hypothetical protein ACJ73C_06115 [Nitrososphaeraceae archaeon]